MPSVEVKIDRIKVFYLSCQLRSGHLARKPGVHIDVHRPPGRLFSSSISLFFPSLASMLQPCLLDERISRVGQHRIDIACSFPLA